MYDSVRCSISSVLYLIFGYNYIKQILLYTDDPLCTAVPGIVNSIGTAKKIQLKKQRPLFFNALEGKSLTDSINAEKMRMTFYKCYYKMLITK